MVSWRASAWKSSVAVDPPRLTRAAILRFSTASWAFRATWRLLHPRNSFLNEVIDRRTGNPISLAIVLMAVCQRAAWRLRHFVPGHFLVGARRATAPWRWWTRLTGAWCDDRSCARYTNPPPGSH